MDKDFSRGKWIALFHPPIYDFTAYDLWLRPLGLYRLGAYIKKYTDLNLFLFDYLDRSSPLAPASKSKKYGTGKFYRERVEKPDVLRKVKRYFYRFGVPRPLMESFMEKFPPPVAVFVTTGMTYWYLGVEEVVRSAKKVWRDVPIFLGGTYATLMPVHASQFGEVLKGEVGCEAVEILGALSGRRFSCGKEPPAAFELSQTDSTVAVTTRGCPFRCSFCASYLLHRWRKRPIAEVMEELEKAVKLSIKDIALYDDALLVDAEGHFKPLFREIARQNWNLRFHLPNGLHVRFVDEEVAWIMKRANFRTLRLSLESVDEEFLRERTPKLRVEEFERAVLYLEKAGFSRKELVAYVIVGVPGQRASSVLKTLDYLEKLGVKPSLAYYSPVPGTKDFQELTEEGYFPEGHDPLLHNKLLFPYMQYSPIGEEEFLLIRQRAFDIASALSS